MNMPTQTSDLAPLRDSVERYAARDYGFERRRGFFDQGWSRGAWDDYASLGWLALRLPEAYGGMEAGADAIGALMEAVGERLMLEPLLASAVLGTGLVLRAADATQRAEWLPRLAEGTLILAFAHDEAEDAATATACTLRGGRLHGAKLAVLHGDCAGAFIVSARDADHAGAPVLLWVDASAPGLWRRGFRLLDGRGASQLEFDGTPAVRLPCGDAAAHIADALDEAAVALCAEAYGAMRALNAATLQYLKVRKQFGRPIGSNQALQHRMVEMTLLAQETRALLRAAQAALAQPAAERARLISGARAFTCGAARRIANEAVQMHGGIGVTEELDVSHYYRRLMVVNALFGNRDRHLARFAGACGAQT